MQPKVRSLQQILTELAPSYNPQIKSIQQRQSLIPQQIKTEEQALGAKQDQAFGDILNGARRRGLGFSGIPLGEQAKYSATEYLPALARLRQSGQEQALTLQDALNQIYERRNTLAQQLRQNDQQRYDNYIANQQQTKALASAFSPSYGSTASNPVAKKDPFAALGNDGKQRAANAIVSLLQTNNPTLVKRTIDAITSSANNGNLYDKLKLDLLQRYRTNSPYGALLNKAYGINARQRSNSVPLGVANPTVVTRF